jgi:hypothetical protein
VLQHESLTITAADAQKSPYIPSPTTVYLIVANGSTRLNLELGFGGIDLLTTERVIDSISPSGSQ